MNRLTYYCPNGNGSGEWRANVRGTEVNGEEINRLATFENLIEKGELVSVIHACKAESAISKTGLMCTACYSDVDRDAVFCKYCGAKMDIVQEMSDIEKLIELFQDTRCSENFINNLQMEKCAEFLVANGVRVQKWIPVSEPPKEYGEYIVMIAGAKRSTTLYYRPKDNSWEDGESNFYNVTNWMPLPEPPEEDEYGQAE